MITITLTNGMRIESGWIDRDDSDALPVGDYISLCHRDGEQLCYIDTADVANDPLRLRRALCDLFRRASAH